MIKIAGALLTLSLSFSLFAQKERPKQPDLPGDFVFDVGMNFLSNSGSLEIERFPSRSAGVYYMYTKKLSDRFTVNPMIGLGMEKYSFKRSVNFLETDDRQIQFDTINDVALDKNVLAVNYVELPVEVRFYPLKTINGEGLFIGVGGMIGLRFESHTKIKYTNENDITRQQKLRANFGLEDVRYGVQARIGLKGVNLFYKQYFNELFRNGVGGENPVTWTVGINVTGF